MKFTIIRIIMALIYIICAYKWGDWKNWRRYYPTMLFFGMGDLIYHVAFRDKPLWTLELDLLVSILNELFVIFTIFLLTTLIYVSKYPKKLSHQIIWILFWILIYTGTELFTSSINMFTYHNGWTIWWSVFHNTVQFPLLILHHKNPILAWIIALVFLLIIMKTFNVPFTITKY